MVVIADASPLNYLVLIQAPSEVASWVANLPGWVRRVGDPLFRSDPILDTLGRGERSAISFAEGLRPDVLLVIDESKGRRAALQRQIPVVGILGILEAASVRGWIDLPPILADLQISESPQA